MVYIHQTYGLEGREEAWRNEKASNRLTGNGLETLRKYGRISEKIFCGREFLKINWVFSTKCFYRCLAAMAGQMISSWWRKMAAMANGQT